jgi:hypothetical protein
MNTLPHVHNLALSAALKPSLRWDGVTSIDTHRKVCSEKLYELLGLNNFTPCEPIFEITSEDELHGHRHVHFTLQTEEGYFTHCDLLLPKNQTGTLPLCATLQGHSKGSHISLGVPTYPGDESSISGGDRDFCVRAVAEGFAALAIEQRAFGQCGGTEQGPACIRPAMEAILMGRTLIGERVWDVMRVVDAIEAHFGDLITMKGSVLMGNSGGGTATYYTACLEHRFDGFMPSCAVCTYRDSIIAIHHCTCNYIPGIARSFDMGDLAVMIAPKKLVVVCGKDDDIFPLHGVQETFGIIETLYKASDAPDGCALVVGNGGHRFYADDAWPVMKGLLADGK